MYLGIDLGTSNSVIVGNRAQSAAKFRVLRKRDQASDQNRRDDRGDDIELVDLHAEIVRPLGCPGGGHVFPPE